MYRIISYHISYHISYITYHIIYHISSYYIFVRHTRLSNYCGKLNNKYVYYTSVCVLGGSLETRIMCVYVDLYCTLLLMSGDPWRSYRGNINRLFSLYIICASISQFCVQTSPAMWWRSVELRSGRWCYLPSGWWLVELRFISNTESVYVGFEIDKVALGRVFPEYFISSISIIVPMLHILLTYMTLL